MGQARTGKERIDEGERGKEGHQAEEGDEDHCQVEAQHRPEVGLGADLEDVCKSLRV